MCVRYKEFLPPFLLRIYGIKILSYFDIFFGAIYAYFQVQNLIERCLQLYMNQKEVVETLLDQAKIEPGFTELGNPFFHIICSINQAVYISFNYAIVLPNKFDLRT